jgi:F0F1-type ATP synthase membrane subunit c/vacuolar-type H+-ATPase subunit K
MRGGCLITLGTLCSRNAWLGAGAMAIVGVAVLFSGVVSGYVAARA